MNQNEITANPEPMEPLIGFNKEDVFINRIDPLLKQLGEVMREEKMNGFVLVEVSLDPELQSGMMSGTCWTSNENYQSFALYVCNKVTRDPEFAMRLDKIMPMLEMNDGKFLQEMLAPNVPAIQVPKFQS